MGAVVTATVKAATRDPPNHSIASTTQAIDGTPSSRVAMGWSA